MEQNIFMPKAFADQLLKTALEAAEAGGGILSQYWGAPLDIKHKQFPSDLVTEVDEKSEKKIISIIKKNFPDHSILAEESGSQMTESEYLWIIDPLDGTTNYAHHYPMVAVSIGLLFQGEPILGVVFNPIRQELFVGVKNLGATLNGRKIMVSQVSVLNQSLLGTGFAYNRLETRDNNYDEYCHFTNLSQGVRRSGSAALDLAYVAQGSLDGYWEQELKPWDIAAGIVLVQEAGGKATSYEMSKVKIQSGQILATNGHIHAKLSQELLLVRKAKEKLH